MNVFENGFVPRRDTQVIILNANVRTIEPAYDTAGIQLFMTAETKLIQERKSIHTLTALNPVQDMEIHGVIHCAKVKIVKVSEERVHLSSKGIPYISKYYTVQCTLSQALLTLLIFKYPHGHIKKFKARTGETWLLTKMKVALIIEEGKPQDSLRVKGLNFSGHTEMVMQN